MGPEATLLAGSSFYTDGTLLKQSSWGNMQTQSVHLRSEHKANT